MAGRHRSRRSCRARLSSPPPASSSRIFVLTPSSATSKQLVTRSRSVPPRSGAKTRENCSDLRRCFTCQVRHFRREIPPNHILLAVVVVHALCGASGRTRLPQKPPKPRRWRGVRRFCRRPARCGSSRFASNRSLRSGDQGFTVGEKV